MNLYLRTLIAAAALLTSCKIYGQYTLTEQDGRTESRKTFYTKINKLMC